MPIQFAINRLADIAPKRMKGVAPRCVARVASRLGSNALRPLLRPAGLFFCIAALTVVLAESRAQIPLDLVRGPAESAPGEYNPADPKFRQPELCENLGGQVTAADDDSVCIGVDKIRTFCLIGSADAFPCRGLFKHVIECNASYNRPALNPFFCAEKCDENAAPPKKALGGECLNVVSPRPAFSPDALNAAFAPNGNVIVEQPGQTYTLALPQNLQYAGQDTRGARLITEQESAQFNRRPDIRAVVDATLFCAGCYPQSFTLVAEFHNPANARLRSAAATMTLAVLTITATLWSISEVENADAVEALLSLGVNAQDDAGQAPLHYAASLNASVLVEKLLEYGAEIDAQDNQGRTPLDIAVAAGNARAQAALLKNGATCAASPACPPARQFAPPAGRRADNVQIETAASVMAKISCEQCGQSLSLLVEFHNPLGAEHHSETATLTVTPPPAAATLWIVAGKTEQPELELLLNRGGDARGENGWAPLHHAAANDDEPLTRKLLQNGAEVNPKNGDGKTPLDLAFDNDSQQSRPILVEYGGVCAETQNPSECPNLLDTARIGSASGVSILLENNHAVNITNSAGKTPLDLAIDGRHAAAQSVLVQNGAVCAERHSRTGCPTLREAAADGNLALLTLLLEYNAPVDAAGVGGQTPLHAAAENGHAAAVSVLLTSGASVNPKNLAQQTPLDLAVTNGHSEATALLIQYDGICLAFWQHDDCPPNLHDAAADGNLALATVLLKEGADVNARNSAGQTPLHAAARNGHATVALVLITSGATVNVTDIFAFNTPLHLAADNGHAAAASVLLAHNASVNAVNSFGGNTPLHLAALSGRATVAAILLEYNASVNARNSFGDAPLHLAASDVRVSTAVVLLDNGAEVNPIGNGGRTPLDRAVDGLHPNARDLLIQYGGVCAAVQNERECPDLHKAAEVGSVSGVSILLANGASVAATDDRQRTPLHWAAQNGHAVVASILIASSAPVDAVNFHRETPLHLAALEGHLAVASVLLDNNAAVNMEDGQGRTPLDRAIAGEQSDMIELLIQRDGLCAAEVGDADCPPGGQ